MSVIYEIKNMMYQPISIPLKNGYTFRIFAREKGFLKASQVDIGYLNNLKEKEKIKVKETK